MEVTRTHYKITSSQGTDEREESNTDQPQRDMKLYLEMGMDRCLLSNCHTGGQI